MTFNQFKHNVRQLILNVKLWFAVRRAKRYYERIDGKESVHVFLQKNRFVILTRNHTRKLMRKGFFKQGFDWADIKKNAIYSIEKK